MGKEAIDRVVDALKEADKKLNFKGCKGKSCNYWSPKTSYKLKRGIGGDKERDSCRVWDYRWRWWGKICSNCYKI